MDYDKYFGYELRINTNLKKFLEGLAKENNEHMVFYLELQPTSVNLYLKDSIQHLYYKIELKHFGQARLTEEMILEKMERPIICLDLNMFLIDISLLNSVEKYYLLYQWEPNQFKIMKAGEQSYEECFEVVP